MNNTRKFSMEHLLKLKKPCRNQVELFPMSLDETLPSDHRARKVWAFVQEMNSDACFKHIKSMYGKAGRPSTCPTVLLALWILATLDGITSARGLVEQCKYHAAYKWIAGGVPINRTMLAEFRVLDALMYRELLTNCLAVVVMTGLVNDTDFSQDGTRVKASAGNNLYKREGSLEDYKKCAEEYLKQLEEENAKNPNAYKDKRQAAALRGAKDMKDRAEKAVEALKQHKEEKIANGKKNRKPPSEKDLQDTRASISDPEARRMKMGDGGFRIGLNVQFATGTESRLIYATHVTNKLDPGTSVPVILQTQKRVDELGLAPIEHWLADAAYSGKEDIDDIAAIFPGVQLISPAQTTKKVDPTVPKKGDSDAVKEWREGLLSEEFMAIYKKRPSTAEFSNAVAKNRGFGILPVRGLVKAFQVSCLAAITHNILRYWDLISKAQLVTA